MKKSILLIVTVLLLACQKQIPRPRYVFVKQNLAEFRGLNDFYIGDFRCGVFVPPSYSPLKKYPIIIRLHGYSDLTSWILDYYTAPVTSLDPAIVLTPKCPITEEAGWGHTFAPGISVMMERVYDMIALVQRTFSVDPSRIYIFGSSMGGYGTYSAIRHTPDLFAAAYVEVGCGNSSMADLVNEIPFWILHGEWDPVVPVSCAQQMFEAVNELGGEQIRYTEYKNIGHDVWTLTNEEQTIVPWLMAQRKGDGPHDSPADLVNPVSQLKEEGVLLHWKAAPVFPVTSDDEIWYVRIFKEDQLLAEVNSDQNSFLDSDVEHGKSYNYTFIGVNYFFKEGVSESLTVEVP